MRKLILASIIFLISSPAFSADYTWSSPAGGNVFLSTALAACKVKDGQQWSTPGTRWQYVSMTFVGSAQYPEYQCRYNTYNADGSIAMSNYRLGNTVRSGTTCTLPAVYDPATYGCKLPDPLEGTVCFVESVTPPRVMQGGQCINLGTAKPETQCKYFAGSGGVRSFYMYETPGGPPQAQPMQDKHGCEVSTAEGFKPEAECKYLPPTPAVPYYSEGVLVPGIAQPGAYKCKASTVLTGNYTPPSNSNGQKPADTICADPGSPACTLAKLEKKTDQKPCTYTTDSAGNQVCVSSKFDATEGKTKCGFVGSEFKCSEDLNKAVGEGISIATKVETKPQPDGKTKVTKTDVQTATSCKGSTCTTKTTTTTTTTIKDGNGTTESVTGVCTGDNCPDKNGNPDGDGDGFGDCTGAECGEGSGKSLTTPELEEVDGYQLTTQKFFNRAKSAPLLSAVGNVQAPTGGAAPNFESAPIAALGGASLDLGFIDQLKPIIADVLSLVMKAVWCFIALIVFLAA